MQKIFLSILFLPALAVLFDFGRLEETKADHDISSVTVYLADAEIQRKGKAEVPAGKSDILFEGLSSEIIEAGLKIGLNEGYEVYAVAIEKTDNFHKTSPDFKDADEKLNALESQLAALDMELDLLEDEREYYYKNMERSGNNPVSFEELDKGAEYFRGKLKDLSNRVADTQKRRTGITEKIADFNPEWQKVFDKAVKRNARIRITVVAEKAGMVEVDLRYIVSQAGWKPHYAIRAGEKTEPIVLDYKARIFNNTGNDWDNKPMTLAVVSPDDDPSKPNMNAWILDKSGYSKNEYRTSSVNKGRVKDESGKVEYQTLEVDDLSTRFEVGTEHFIPADAAPHMIDVNRFEDKADFYTLSIPKIKQGAFLIAQIEGWNKLGLIAGDMDLYYKGDYQGTTFFAPNTVSDTLEVSLGLENSYFLTRRLEASKRKSFGLNVKESLQYEILVENKKSVPATIEVRDQIPVAVDKDVEVKPINLSGAEVDALSGQLTWELDLKPNERRKIILSFQVKYPKSARGILSRRTKTIVTPRYF